MCFNLALSFYVCMYVYVLPVSHVSGVARVCVFVHMCAGTCTYISMAYVCIRICVLGFICLVSVGPAMRATRAYIHTYDVAAHCATVARRHRYSGAMSPHIRMYVHMLYLGLCVLHALGQP